jgi:hypothetical protein
MDTVELVMGFEEALGILIPDEDAARLLTPRRVLDYAAACLPVVHADGCATQRTFYALRRGFRACGVHVELRPATPLRALTDRQGWTVLWTRVRVAVGNAGWPASVPYPGLLSDGPATLGQLTRHVAVASLVTDAGWTRERIEFVIRQVMWDVAGIDDFSLDDEFVRDLKLD